MPRAIRSGVPMTEFYNLTPTIIDLYAKEYERKTQEQCDMLTYNAWLQGSYVQAAIVAAFSKDVSYPENPLLKNDNAETDGQEEQYVGEMQFLQFINELNKRVED